MLGTLPSEKKKSWPRFIGMLVLAYNATPHESTGFSPFYLLFGRQPRLPVDNLFSRETKFQQVEEVREALKRAWDEAAKRDAQSKERSTRYYDRKVRGATLEIGDRVLVKECSFEGPHKLKDKWTDDVFIVVEKPHPDVPVYRVRPESGGRMRTLHRNLLLPVQSIRDGETPLVSMAPVPKVVEPQQPETPTVVLEPDTEVESNCDETSADGSEIEEEEDYYVLDGEPDRRIIVEPPTLVPTPVPRLEDRPSSRAPAGPPVTGPPVPAPRRPQCVQTPPQQETVPRPPPLPRALQRLQSFNPPGAGEAILPPEEGGRSRRDAQVLSLYTLLDHPNSDKMLVTAEIVKLLLV